MRRLSSFRERICGKPSLVHGTRRWRRAAPIDIVRLPLRRIDHAAMKPFRGQHICVLKTASYDGMQAAVRLRRVLNFERVTLVQAADSSAEQAT